MFHYQDKDAIEDNVLFFSLILKVLESSTRQRV